MMKLKIDAKRLYIKLIDYLMNRLVFEYLLKHRAQA